jgi:hypothetical protein
VAQILNLKFGLLIGSLLGLVESWIVVMLQPQFYTGTSDNI